MALTEIQKTWLTKDTLYKNLMLLATELDGRMKTLEDKVEWLNLISPTDLNDIAVPAATQTLLGNYRTALNSLIVEYNTSIASIADQIRML